VKQILLHIGTGKTGTSSIQNLLFLNRQLLRDRCSADYLDCGRSSSEHFGETIHAHYPVVRWLLERDSRSLSALKNAIEQSHCERILLSCEDFFHHLDEERVNVLQGLLAKFDVRIICYVRRQDLYIESAWKQQAKVGALRMPFAMFLERHTQAKFLGEVHANYHRMLEKWTAAFGRDAIRVRVFDSSEFVGRDLVDDFMDACGIGDKSLVKSLQRPPRTNIALPSELAELLRRVNVSGLVSSTEQQAFVAYVESLIEYRDQPLLSPADQAAVLANYAESNVSLFRDYLERPPPPCFTAPPSPAPTATSEPKRVPDAAIKCLVATWQQQRPAPRSWLTRLADALNRGRKPRGARPAAAHAPAVALPSATSQPPPVWPPVDVPLPLPYPPTLSPREVVAVIKRHQASGTPLSIIRLGDGEAVVMGYPEDVGEEPFNGFMKVFFGRHRISPEQRSQLVRELRDSIRHADIIGVPGGTEINKFTAARHLLAKYQLVNEKTGISNLSLHRNLQEHDLFKAFLQNLDEVGLVTCRDVAPFVQEAFNIKNVTVYKIPEEAQHAANAKSVGRHFPERFEDLRSTLKVPKPGTVFLVGAGPCGKVYCQWIKERGGIAIDIGSVFDGWAGIATRAFLRPQGKKGRQHLDPKYLLKPRTGTTGEANR